MQYIIGRQFKDIVGYISTVKKETVQRHHLMTILDSWCNNSSNNVITYVLYSIMMIGSTVVILLLLMYSIMVEYCLCDCFAYCTATVRAQFCQQLTTRILWLANCPKLPIPKIPKCQQGCSKIVFGINLFLEVNGAWLYIIWNNKNKLFAALLTYDQYASP